MQLGSSFLILSLLFSDGDAKMKILVVGGSGRVGGSAVRSLFRRYGETVSLSVAGRNAENWMSYKRRKGPIPADFIDLDSKCMSEKLDDVVRRFDLIINTAGPFQQSLDPLLLRVAMSHGKKYIDVCDDIKLSRVCRGPDLQSLAARTGGTAIISTGIWPGASSLLSQELIQRCGGIDMIEESSYSFFTAGSGGAGPTILTATFLIIGENVLVYRNGKETYFKSATDTKEVDFGKGIGVREVSRLNLIECESGYISGLKTIDTYFGTAPKVWNDLFRCMANLIPQKILQDSKTMSRLADISLPLVRLVDKLVGAKNGSRT